MGRHKRFLRVCIVFLLIFIVYALYSSRQHESAVPAPPGYYYVAFSVDGDTIAVDMNGVEEKVRLIGVDTPETHKPNTPVQCYGVIASDFTKTHTEHTNVRLESDSINQDRDRYGRLLRYVYLQDGTLWNAELVRLGYGRALTAFPFTKLKEFESYEKDAKTNNRGLWANCQ